MEKLSPESEFYYGIVKDYVTIDEFNEIFEGFNKYDGYDKKHIPHDVFRLIEMSKRITFDDELFDGLHLVLLTTIIELLTTWDEYIPFNDWYTHNEDKYKNKKCLRTWSDYISIHGKRKNFRSFFIDLESNEKLELLQYITKRHKKGEDLRHFCFQGKDCIYDKFTCNYKISKNWCPAFNDEKVLNKGIKEFANHLYDFRSLFVHEARIPRFASAPPSRSDNQDNDHTIWLKSSIAYMMKENNRQTTFISELYAEDFFNLITNNLVKMMKKYLKKVKI